MNLKMTKRILSFVLTLALLMGNFPAVVFAAEEEIPAPTEVAAEEPAEATEAPAAEETSAPTEFYVEETEATAAPVVEETEPSEIAENGLLAAETEPAETLPEGYRGGTTDNGLNWLLEIATGTLTVSGTGVLADLHWWTITDRFNDDVKHVIVEEGITAIGDYVFNELESLITVTLPKGVTSVGEQAFYNCQNLTTVNQVDPLTSIGRSAFYQCKSLTEIKLGEGLTEIPDNAFQYAAFESITFPSTLRKIGYRAFAGCSKLKSIQFNEGLQSIGTLAFVACDALTSVTLPESVTSFGSAIFSDCDNLTTVVLPKNMKEIPESMFHRCTELTNVTLPPKLEKIGYQAFHSCWEFKDIKLPATLKEIGGEAFLNSRMTSINLPEGLLRIEERAFCGTHITGITLPKSLDYLACNVFESCSELTEIKVASGNPYYLSKDGVVYTLGGKILHTFPRGLSGGTYTVPAGVQGIGAYAFYCCKFDKLVLPKGVTDISDYALAGPISTIELPKTVKTIGESNFYWEELTDIYYAGSEADWGKIQIGDWNYLDGITIHFGGEMSSGSFDGGNFRWELGGDGKLVIYGTGALPDFADAEDVPWYSVREEITSVLLPADISKIGKNAFLDCTAMTTITLPNSLRQIGERAFYGCTALKDVIFQGSQEEYQRITIGKYNDPLKKAAKTYERVSDYLDNSAIVINGSGSAWAYYQASPNQTVKFTVGDTAGTATADKYGILRVPLGSFTKVGTHRVNVAFTQIGIHKLDPAYVMTATVTVHPQSYTQNWKLTMGAEVGAGIGPGIPSNPIGLEAKLFEVEGSVGAGVASNISRSYSNGTNTLKLTTDVMAEAGAGVKSGITGDVNKVKFNLFSASAGVKGGVTGTYGIQIDNYSLSNLKQQMAVGTYFLDQVLTANPNTVIFMPFYGFLADTVYEETGSSVIYGSGASLTASASVSGGALEVNGKTLFEAGKIGSSMAVSMSEQYNTKGEVSRNATFSAEKAMSFFAGGSIMNVENEGLGLKMLGTDFSVSYKKGGGKEAMEVSTLADPSSGMRMFLFGEAQSYDYMKYTFEGASLSELRKNSSAINSYVNGTNLVIGAGDIINIAKAVSTGYAPIAYTRQTKDELVYAVPVDVAGYFGIDAKLKATVSYAESGEFDRETGYAIHDQLYTVSKPDMTQIPTDTEMTLLQIMTAGLVSLKDKAQEFFRSVAGKITDGVNAGWAWVEGKAESAREWTVEIISAAGDALGISYNVDVHRLSSENTVLSGGIRSENANSGNYELSKAATIGRAFYINVIDDATGEPVADFGTEPMEFTIRYAAEDLEAAGLSALSAVVLDGQIAMYRYSDNGDYFEYVGGVNDLSAMTVTAQITKPGQYVLAVDSCAPELNALNLSDFRQTPTIEANLDDLTGLDTSKFVFKLDGVVKVDGTNISEYYNSLTGVFTYTVSESDALAEGEHTLSFTLADTSGNMDNYEYRFPVDLTVPVISDVTVEGAVNMGAVVEIRAQVSDKNLTAVQALLSKRLSDGSWSDEVSTEMGDMGNGLWGIDYEGDGSSVRVRVCAEDIAANQSYSDVLEAKPFVESVQMEQEYLALRVGQIKALNVEVKPAELAASLEWSVEEGGKHVISVDPDGNVTANAPGTAYVLAEATDGDVTFVARCRVDVAENLELNGVKLSTEKATVELYSTNYTGLDVLLMLPQNYTFSETGSNAQEEAPSAAISDAYFTDPKIAELFGLKICDDRSVQIVPSADAINAVGSVAKKYTGTVTVVVEGKTYETGNLTLDVKKTQPKVKLKIGTFNSFYSGQSQTIQVSGATVTAINADSTKENPLPAWLALHNGELTLTEAAPQKAASGKAQLEIWTEEWAVPVRTALTVKNSYQAPKLKLSVSSAQLSSYTGSSEGIKIQLMPKNKKESLEGLKVCGIAAPAGYSIVNYADDGTFTLKAEKGFSSGKINLEVSFSDTDKTVSLPVTVKSTPVKLKLAKTNIILNAGIGDSALVSVTATPKDFVVAAPTIRLTDSTGADKLGSGELEVRYENGAVRINTTAQTPDKASYKLSISAGGSKAVTITINTVSAVPSVTFKATGSMDLSFPNQTATITPTFKNCGGGFDSFEYTIAEMKGKTVINENVTNAFEVTREGNLLKVRCVDETVNISNTYMLKLKLILEDGSSVENTISLKVKRTAVKLKLSITKLTLNKLIGDKATIDVSCTTKGYDFVEPVLELKDSKNKDAAGQLDIAYDNGKLNITTNDETVYGASYKVLVKANAYATATTLTVSIPKADKSAVTATVKASGSIDVIRDGSAITLTPAYKNVTAQTEKIESLVFYKTANKVTMEANELFDYTVNANGTITVTKAKDAALDHSAKYTVMLVTDVNGSQICESKPISISVKMGATKLTLKASDTMLFAQDKHDRVVFRFDSADKALNEVVKIEIKDAKYKDMFEILDYGNGEFAIGFKDSNVSEKLIGKKTSMDVTLNLNVFIDGNETVKPNTTAKIKLTIVK